MPPRLASRFAETLSRRGIGDTGVKFTQPLSGRFSHNGGDIFALPLCPPGANDGLELRSGVVKEFPRGWDHFACVTLGHEVEKLEFGRDDINQIALIRTRFQNGASTDTPIEKAQIRQTVEFLNAALQAFEAPTEKH